MRSYMQEMELDYYINSQIEMLNNSIYDLDDTWEHNFVIRQWCQDTINQLNILKNYRSNNIGFNDGSVEKKSEKYTKWVEVMRLAFFQYARFTERRYARSEGLYSTLVSLALTWGKKDIERIVIPGCGPGRSVLDFSRIYSNAEVLGVDYSALALALGEKIVCGNEKISLLQRDVYSGNTISKEYTIDGFGLKNASFGLINLITNDIPMSDMIVCSNTINLLPNHDNAIRSIVQSLRPGGIVIFADLIGWRLDREKGRRVLCDDESIKRLFEKYEIETLDMFSGVPYIEMESDDQETCYNEHFYVGRRPY